MYLLLWRRKDFSSVGASYDIFSLFLLRLTGSPGRKRKRYYAPNLVFHSETVILSLMEKQPWHTFDVLKSCLSVPGSFWDMVFFHMVIIIFLCALMNLWLVCNCPCSKQTLDFPPKAYVGILTYMDMNVNMQVISRSRAFTAVVSKCVYVQQHLYSPYEPSKPTWWQWWITVLY